MTGSSWQLREFKHCSAKRFVPGCYCQPPLKSLLSVVFGFNQHFGQSLGELSAERYEPMDLLVEYSACSGRPSCGGRLAVSSVRHKSQFNCLANSRRSGKLAE
jgi:hypothetical protein